MSSWHLPQIPERNAIITVIDKEDYRYHSQRQTNAGKQYTISPRSNGLFTCSAPFLLTHAH